MEIITPEERLNDIVRMFAKFGFIDTPLKPSDIEKLIAWGWNDVSIYRVGCDCYCGYSFNEALDANLEGQA